MSDTNQTHSRRLWPPAPLHVCKSGLDEERHRQVTARTGTLVPKLYSHHEPERSIQKSLGSNAPHAVVRQCMSAKRNHNPTGFFKKNIVV